MPGLLAGLAGLYCGVSHLVVPTWRMAQASHWSARPRSTYAIHPPIHPVLCTQNSNNRENVVIAKCTGYIYTYSTYVQRTEHCVLQAVVGTLALSRSTVVRKSSIVHHVLRTKWITAAIVTRQAYLNLQLPISPVGTAIHLPLRGTTYQPDNLPTCWKVPAWVVVALQKNLGPRLKHNTAKAVLSTRQV